MAEFRSLAGKTFSVLFFFCLLSLAIDPRISATRVLGLKKWLFLERSLLHAVSKKKINFSKFILQTDKLKLKNFKIHFFENTIYFLIPQNGTCDLTKKINVYTVPRIAAVVLRLRPQLRPDIKSQVIFKNPSKRGKFKQLYLKRKTFPICSNTL